MQKYQTIALIVAGGTGSRFGGDLPKQYRMLAGKTILRRSVEAFLRHERVDAVRVVIHPQAESLYRQAMGDLALLSPVHGGEVRAVSVRNGLESLAEYNPDYVLIHDAARPFVSAEVIDRVLDGLATSPAVLPAIRVKDTIKRVNGAIIEETVARDALVAVQTPQGFHYREILNAHTTLKTPPPLAGEARNPSAPQGEQSPTSSPVHGGGKKSERSEGEPDFLRGSGPPQQSNQAKPGRFLAPPASGRGEINFPDDGAVMEAAGFAVTIVDGSASNSKITTQEDYMLAQNIMAETRVGMGTDVHAFTQGDHVMVCGVKIPYNQGLAGHSDADVGLHAMVDALLGAIAREDIGYHFSPKDPQWKGADSSLFMRHAAKLVREAGGEIIHMDVTIIGEEPKMAPHRDAMRARVAELLEIDLTRVSVKATTTEKLGFTGRGEGLAAQAVASVRM